MDSWSLSSLGRFVSVGLPISHNNTTAANVDSWHRCHQTTRTESAVMRHASRPYFRERAEPLSNDDTINFSWDPGRKLGRRVSRGR
jgi:hypothetical protein